MNYAKKTIDFIYITKNTSKQKKITKKIAKKKTIKVKWNRGNTNLLIWWIFMTKKAWDRSEERRGKEWWKTEEKRKWTEEAVEVG